MNNEPEGFHALNVKDMWRILIGAAVTVTASFLFDRLAAPVYMRLSLKGGEDEQLRLNYAKKAARCSYQATYFTVATIWGFIVLRDTAFLPWWMGGKNTTLESYNTLFADSPFTPYSTGVFNYFLYTTGYHFGGFVVHIIINRDANDFHEMLLHHIATLALMTGSFLANFMAIGACIAWLHDIGQVPL